MELGIAVGQHIGNIPPPVPADLQAQGEERQQDVAPA
jgi:hypothetical protein